MRWAASDDGAGRSAEPMRIARAVRKCFLHCSIAPARGRSRVRQQGSKRCSKDSRPARSRPARPGSACASAARDRRSCCFTAIRRRHVMWHRVAPALAERFTRRLPDLRGYGDSGKPTSDPEHAAYSKRSNGAGHGRGDGRRSATTASCSPATTAAGGSATAWRSTIRTGSSGWPCSTSCRPARSSARPTRRSRPATSTGSS